ncbi:MAG: efflux RND transporter periplasmic adaptor subunit [bacterium]
MKTERNGVLAAIKKRKNAVAAVTLILLLVVGAVLARTGIKRSRKIEVAQKPPIPVTAFILKPVEYIEEMEYTGKLEAASEIVVVAKAGGTIVKDLINEGDRVEKGQPLCRLDDDSYRFAMQQAKAALDLARESQQEAKSALKKAQSDADRFTELYREGAVSLSQKESADLALATASVRASDASVRQAQAAYNLAKDAWEETVVRSPISGIVASKSVFAGDTVSEGTPIAEIVDLSSFRIHLGVSGADVMHIYKGDSVYVQIIPGEKKYEALVEDVGVKADERTGTFPVILRMANPGQEKSSALLRAGMDVKVMFVKVKLSNALVIPTSALLQETDSSAVFVADGEVAVRKVVVPGPSNEVSTVISGGLREGELVIIVGQHRLRTGDKLEMAVEQ